VGKNWFKAIKQAMEQCDYASLLLSPEFFSPDFIRDNELPWLYKNRSRDREHFRLSVSDVDLKHFAPTEGPRDESAQGPRIRPPIDSKLRKDEDKAGPPYSVLLGETGLGKNHRLQSLREPPPRPPRTRPVCSSEVLSKPANRSMPPGLPPPPPRSRLQIEQHATMHFAAPQPVEHLINVSQGLHFDVRDDTKRRSQRERFLHVGAGPDQRATDRDPFQNDIEDRQN
jgi:hypothetical protein